LGAFFIFFLGTLIFLAQKDVSVLSIGCKDALHALLFALGGIISGFLPAYVYCFVKRKGFRWLWLGFIFQAIIITAFIITLNIPNTPLKGVQKVPYVSRLGELSYKAESGTTRVRVLIWDGTIDLIRSNPFRMIVGYGPESMKHVWDQHAPAELAQHESKSAAPDRAHNEAFDRIVTTGIIGLLIYMCLVGSVFYYSLKWLGLINSQSQRVLFFVLTIFGGILGVALPRIIQGSFSFAGVGLALGYIVSISIYMVVAPFMMRIVKHNDNIPVWKHFLILGLLSGITAHFIEIHFGIAIVSTRLYFFVFSAVIVALGIRELNAPITNVQASSAQSIAENSPKKGKPHRTKRKQTNKQVNAESPIKPASRYIPFRPVMVYTLLIGLAISTINFSFIIHQPSQTDTFGIIWLSLVGQKQTYGTLILLIVTYLMGGLLVLNSLLTAYHGNGRRVDFLGSMGVYTATNLLIFFVSSSVQTSYLKPGMDVSAVINFFFIFVLILGLAASYFLMPPLKTLSSVRWKKKALWAYPLIVFVAFLTIATSNIAPVRADIYLKLGQVQERNYRWNEGIRLVTRAIETDPYEETFYLNLGRILFGKANSSPDLNEKNATFEKIREVMERAHSLNPMNTDHTANLGLFYLRWAEFDPTPEGRQKKLGTSSLYFQEALEKSPKKTIILNNWARVIAAEGKFDESIKVLDRSLALDNAFAGTYIALGDIYGMYGRSKEAIRAYEKAVSYDQSNADAMSMLGLIYFKEGRLNEALELSRRATELRPDLMKAQSLLGLIYFKLGRFQEAIDANLKVLSMRPSDIGAHRNLVILYEKIGRRDKAIKHLEAAIQFSPPQEKRQLEQILQYMHSGKSQGPGILN
jgi:tetratricopeptide (TPR) repeat protein